MEWGKYGYTFKYGMEKANSSTKGKMNFHTPTKINFFC